MSYAPTLPLPAGKIRKRCSCGAKFWNQSDYFAHYALYHLVLGDYDL